MDYKKKLDKIMYVRKINAICGSTIAVLLVLAFYFLSLLFPSSPSIGDKVDAYHLQSIAAVANYKVYFLFIGIAIGISILLGIYLFVLNRKHK